MSENLTEVYQSLLSGDVAYDDERRKLLEGLGFGQPRAAVQGFLRLGDRLDGRHELLAIMPRLLAGFGQAASPDRALVNFERFTKAVADPLETYRYLAAHPHSLHMLLTLFASSQFLTEILLRNPGFFPRVTQRDEIAYRKPAALMHAEARAAVTPSLAPVVDRAGRDAALDALRRFQRAEYLRIGMADLTGLLDLASVATQLSHLADGILQVCLEIAAAYTELSADAFAIIAMGKLGGGELNYSSDIDLLFLVDADAAQYQRFGAHLVEMLSAATGEGFLYRVDMRLRPWGKVGPLVSTVQGYLAYLEQHARLWEKQALLKARMVTGNPEVGRSFLRKAWPLLYQFSPEQVRVDLQAMKQRTEDFLRQQGRHWGEVKLGAGSIRDVEFVTQYLQLVHNRQHPEIRSGNTLASLSRLTHRELLSPAEYRILADGYVFLRTVEHYLQILEYRQTYTLPSAQGDLEYLAHRLGFEGLDAGARFVACYGQHSAAIRAVYLSYLGGDAMGSPATPSEPVSEADIHQHIERMAPTYHTTFSDAEIQRHAVLAARLDESQPVVVEATAAKDDNWTITIVGYDYLGELTLICGLLFTYGFSIMDGHVYTYEADGRPLPNTRRKIVDVFTVRSVVPQPAADIWTRYAQDLSALIRRLQAREQREAQGELAKRVALALRKVDGSVPTLYPIDIAIDNDNSERYTILRINTPDTVGFLYEFTNALALNGVYISQVTVTSVGNRVNDVLYVTDAQGRKIISPARQRELRAATVLIKHFTHLLPHSPNPESALLHFHEYLGQLFQRPSWPDDLASLERPEVLNALARLLGVSDFLWDDFLRMQYANLFPLVRDVDTLTQPRTNVELAAELAATLDAAPEPVGKREALNAFKDREMFRIDMRQIQGYLADPTQFQRELTDLAEVVVYGAWELCYAELRAQYGAPREEDGRPSALTICALGKCGGRELGFASDIELMFIFTGTGNTGGPRVITSTEFYEKVVVDFLRTIRARREGIFEIDLQLRPYGNAGSLAVSLDSYRRYFAPAGAAWSYERQALVKLRPIGGDPALGRQVQALRDSFVYSGTPFDVAGMRAMRERQLRHLVPAGTISAKYSQGGLVDVEYLVQGLQISHGHRDLALRVTNTTEALAALAQAGIISTENDARLQAAHAFLQGLINALRMVRGNNKDLTVPPTGSEDFAFLARRLGYGDEPARLQVSLMEHLTWVQRLSARLLG